MRLPSPPQGTGVHRSSWLCFARNPGAEAGRSARRGATNWVWRLLAVLGLLPAAGPVAAQEPGLTVAAWLQRVQTQVYPYRVDADWFLLPAAEPGVTADLVRVIDGTFPLEIRGRAVRALGQLGVEASVAVPKLGELLGHDEEPIRREAVGALRHFGRAAQSELWQRARDFALVRSPPRSDARVPATVSLYAVSALAGLPDLDPRPLIDDYRRAVARGRWVEAREAGEFMGSIAHLKTILSRVFRAPHEATATGLAAYFGDTDPVVRQLAFGASDAIRDAAPILPEVVRSLSGASSDEKRQFAKLLRYGGRGAVPVLTSLLEQTFQEASDALLHLLWEEPLDYVVAELGKGGAYDVRKILLQVLLNRLSGQSYPPGLERELLGAVSGFFREARSVDDLEEILIRGKLRRNPAGEDLQHDQANPPVWRLPLPLVRGMAEALVALPAAQEKAEDIAKILVLFGVEAGTDRVVAWIRSLEAKAPADDRANFAVLLAVLGRPPANLASQLTQVLESSGSRALTSMVEHADARTDSGAQLLLTMILAITDPQHAENVAEPAFWRLIAAAGDPAPVARKVRAGSRSAEVRTLAEAVLAYAGTPAERDEIGRSIDLPKIQDARGPWSNEKTAALLAGAPPAAKRAALAAVGDSVSMSDGIETLVKALDQASTLDPSGFSWESELAALASRALPTLLEPLHLTLLRTPAGRTALLGHLETKLETRAQEDPRDWTRDRIEEMKTCLQTAGSCPTLPPRVAAAIRSLAADRRGDRHSRPAALRALARCSPETLVTQNIWAQAVQDPEATIRQAALDGIEMVLGQLPHLRPVWLAGSMREREEGQNQRDSIWREWTDSAEAIEVARKKEALRTAPAPGPAAPAAPPASSASFLSELMTQMQLNPADVPSLAAEAVQKRPDLLNTIFAVALTTAPAQAAAVARRLAASRPGSVPEIAWLVKEKAPAQWLAAVTALAADQPKQAPLLVRLGSTVPGQEAATLTAAAAASKRTEAELSAEAKQISPSAVGAVTAAVATVPPQTSTPSAEMQAFQNIYFPWPPPPPVIWDEFGGEHAPLKRRWLGGDTSTLGEVEERLRSSLGATYGDLDARLFPVPGGFALVTRIERIKATGQPYPGAHRWSRDDSIRPDWPAWMFYEVPGYFRKIVFVVTSDFLPKWRVGFVIPDPGSGAPSLPPELRQKSFKDLKAYVLVYSYQRRPSGLYYPFGTLTAAQHVRLTGMLRYLDSATLR